MWQAYAAAVGIGLSSAAFWPAHGALLSALAPGAASHGAFAVSNVMRNAGLGLGAGIGGLVASTSHPQTYVWLFAIDAATCVLGAALVARVPAAVRPAPEGPSTATTPGFRVALADRALLVAVALQASFVCFTVAAFDFLAPFLKAQAGLDESAVGLIWLANTCAVTLLQLPAARLAGGHRRMRGIAAASGFWALGLLGFSLAGLVSGAAAVAVAVIGAGVFALGECLQGPLQSALIGEIAPPALEGRYQALASMSWDLGGLAGPPLAGAVFAASPSALWPVFALATLLTGAAALRADGTLPETARITPAWRAPVAEPAPC
jgi:MFS family permease